MQLIPIKTNTTAPNESCQEIHQQTLDYYDVIGYAEPWISYYLQDHEEIVGVCSFKGKPDQRNWVEIAYYTFAPFEGKGYGSKMCALLTEIGEKHEDVTVSARTLPQSNRSTRILAKNGFHCLGSVIDPEDGEVWEWRR